MKTPIGKIKWSDITINGHSEKDQIIDIKVPYEVIDEDLNMPYLEFSNRFTGALFDRLNKIDALDMSKYKIVNVGVEPFQKNVMVVIGMDKRLPADQQKNHFTKLYSFFFQLQITRELDRVWQDFKKPIKRTVV